MNRLNDLPKLCGLASLVEQAAPIREKAISDALEAGVDANELRRMLDENLFHARPWVEGPARRAIDRMIKEARETRPR